MRVLEIGLRSLATQLGGVSAAANWGGMLDQIEKAIHAINSKTHGPGWKADQQRYSEAAWHFRLLKDAWRNHAMHAHARYDEVKAREIWSSVEAFMRHLATWLHE